MSIFTPRIVAAVVLLLVCPALMAACIRQPRAKRTFVGATTVRPMDAEIAVGLNPLGSLDVCRDSLKPLPLVNRVLVSRPEVFTQDASQMIVELRQGLGNPSPGEPSIQMMLSVRPITSESQALAEGRDCGALLVLWEPARNQTLELAFPFPTRIPLRDYSVRRLCLLGDFYQRVNVLYYTILGTADIMNNRFQRAQHHLHLANLIDTECLKLPRLLPES